MLKVPVHSMHAADVMCLWERCAPEPKYVLSKAQPWQPCPAQHPPVAEQYTTRAWGSAACRSFTLSPTCTWLVSGPRPSRGSTLEASTITGMAVRAVPARLVDLPTIPCRPLIPQTAKPSTCVEREPASGTRFLALWPVQQNSKMRAASEHMRKCSAPLLVRVQHFLVSASHMGEAPPSRHSTASARGGGRAKRSSAASKHSLSSKTMSPSKSVPHQSTSCLNRLRPCTLAWGGQRSGAFALLPWLGH